jgi:uncharacterized protein (DUF1501 family)
MSPFTRRGFLHGLAGLSLPAWFPRLAFSAAGSGAPARDVLVCVFLRGGADALNAVAPLGDDHYFDARPTLALRESGDGAALPLDGFFGLHPALAPLVELWDEGLCGAVHAVGMPHGTHSHFDAMDFMERGTPGEKSLSSGWLGRHLATVAAASGSPFRAVGMGQIVQASLRGPVAATALQSIADFHLGRSGQEQEIARFQASLASLYAGDGWLDLQAQQTFDAIALLQAADPLRHQPAHGAAYPESAFGLGLRQVAQLIKAEVGLEVACLDVGGWDTHQGQGAAQGPMAALLADLAQGLHAFATDLADRLAGTTVVTMSEFGRRVAQNASGGTDHGNGGAMLLVGGHVAGGRVHGSWPGLAPEQLADPGDLAVTTDYRTVLAEILERRLGNARVDEVFPGFTPEGYLGVVR